MDNNNPYASALGQKNPYEVVLQSKPPATENFLKSVISRAGGNASEIPPSVAAIGPGGIGTSFAGAKNLESGLRPAFQAIGNVVGGDIGLTTAGAPIRGAAVGGTLGAMTGEAGAQAISKVFRGKSISPSEFGKQSLTSAGTEVANMPLNLVGHTLFSGPAGKEYRNITGKAVTGIKERMFGNPSFRYLTQVQDVVPHLKDIVNRLRGFVQVNPEISGGLERLATDLETTGASKGGFLDPEDVVNAKNRLDNALESFGVYGKKPVAKDYSEVGQMVQGRHQLSNRIQHIADQIGVGNAYRKANEVFSKVASSYPKGGGKHGLLKTLMEARGIGALARGSIGEATRDILASEAIGSNPLWKGMYQTAKIGKGLPAAGAAAINWFRKPTNKS